MKGNMGEKNLDYGTTRKEVSFGKPKFVYPCD